MADAQQLQDFVGGWLTGDFSPALVRQDVVEVAVKHYRAGDQEAAHHHRVAVEYTVIASGKVRMAGQDYERGEIVRIDRGESTDFQALEDTVTVVLKFPSAANDKYLD